MQLETTMKGIITMFEEIITSKELKIQWFREKVYRICMCLLRLIIKLILESYDRKIMQSRNKENIGIRIKRNISKYNHGE